MKKVFSILMVAFAMTAMVACGKLKNGKTIQMKLVSDSYVVR